MRTPTIPQRIWDIHRNDITERYRDQNSSAKDVLKYLESEHRFRPTLNQFENQVRTKWGIYKNVTKAQWQNLIPIVDGSRLDDVKVGNIPINRKKLQRAKKWASRPSIVDTKSTAEGQYGKTVSPPLLELGTQCGVGSKTPFAQFDLAISEAHYKQSGQARRRRRTPVGPVARTTMEAEDTVAATGVSPTGSTHQLEQPCGSLHLSTQNIPLYNLEGSSPTTGPKILLADIVGVQFGLNNEENDVRIATQLRKVMFEHNKDMITREIQDFSKASESEQVFRLLRYAACLASNDFLPQDKADRLLEWILDSNNFLVVEFIIAMQTATASAFASVLLVSLATRADFAACNTLLKGGTDPNGTVRTCTSQKVSPLGEAVKAQDAALVRLFLDNGADVNKKSESLKSPMHTASLISEFKDSYGEIVRLLIDKGADTHEVIPSTSSPGSTTLLNSFIESENIKVVEIFVQAKAHINYPAQHPTPLQVAAATGSVELVEMLLKAGAGVDGRISTELIGHGTSSPSELHICAVWTPLQVALSGNHEAVAEVLLREGAGVNGFHARHILQTRTCRTENHGLFRFGESGTEDARDAASPPGEESAKRGRHRPCRHELLVGASPLQMAALNGNVSMRRLLLSLGARENVDGGFGTDLQVATTRTENLPCVKPPLEAGATVHSPAADARGGTALQAAAETGDNDTAQLLQHGARFDRPPGCQGGTALQVGEGAGVNAPPSVGATALQRAVAAGSPPFFCRLLAKGADVDALECAARFGRLDMACILVHKDAHRETLWLRCRRAAALAASSGFPVLARQLPLWEADLHR